MKIIAKRDIIIACVVIVVLLIVVLFYFYPAPNFIKNDYSESIKVKRCIYTIGIGYHVPPTYDDGFNTLYNSEGDIICVSGGLNNKKSEGACEQKICFPFYR